VKPGLFMLRWQMKNVTKAAGYEGTRRVKSNNSEAEFTDYQRITRELIFAAISRNSSGENFNLGFLKLTSSIESMGTR
jgi:hypothetical protein